MRDLGRMVTLNAGPEALCPRIKTTDPLESPFASLRLKAYAAKRYNRVIRATALILKLFTVPEELVRRLRGSKLLPQVY